MNRLIAFCGMALVAGAVSAAGAGNNVWITEAKVKGANSFALDLETEGSVAAFQFFVKLPAGVREADVDLSKCLSALPKSHQGGCVFKDGQVRLGAFSPTLEAFPAGMTSIGSITIKGKGLGAVELTDVELSDKSSKVIPSTVHVEREEAAHAK